MSFKSYKIDEIHHRNMYGKLLWKETIVGFHLFGVDDTIVHNKIYYYVKRVALANNVLHTNLEVL
jgi:hypothetical protein